MLTGAFRDVVTDPVTAPVSLIETAVLRASAVVAFVAVPKKLAAPVFKLYSVNLNPKVSVRPPTVVAIFSSLTSVILCAKTISAASLSALGD